ncbi:hypothetical protein EBL87_03245 [Cereibacter sphaeroides]|nr:hypothetical protein EBL87_03245 [Cereibacter sphaeroides]
MRPGLVEGQRTRRPDRLGAEAGALAKRGADEVVDLGGGVLAPAFGDGHAHPLQGGLEKLGPQVRSCGSVAEIVACVQAWAQAHPEQEWIYGGSYDATLAPGGMFDARWLACRSSPRWPATRARRIASAGALRSAGSVNAAPPPAGAGGPGRRARARAPAPRRAPWPRVRQAACR